MCDRATHNASYGDENGGSRVVVKRRGGETRVRPKSRPTSSSSDPYLKESVNGRVLTKRVRHAGRRGDERMKTS